MKIKMKIFNKTYKSIIKINKVLKERVKVIKIYNKRNKFHFNLQLFLMKIRDLGLDAKYLLLQEKDCYYGGLIFLI